MNSSPVMVSFSYRYRASSSSFSRFSERIRLAFSCWRFTSSTTCRSISAAVSAEQARELLLNWLSHSPESVTELRVVHGYNRGTLLRDMVRQELTHPRIRTKLPALNPGETRLILK